MSRARKRIFKGIYEDDSGIAIVVSVNGTPREFRHDPDGKPYRRYERHTLPDVRKKIEARERLKAERATVASNTFAHDVERYLKTISSSSHRRNSRGYLAHWQVFNDRDRHAITDIEVRQRFAEIDKAPSTKNHIRHALIHFYRTLNGPTGYNPALVLKKVREEYDDARALPYDAIEKIFGKLQPSPSKARLMVMAYTGLPQSLIARLEPKDLHLDQARVWVKPRRKGKGAPGRMLPLSPAGVTALKEFQRLNAFGTFQNKQLARTFNHGATLAGVVLPTTARPYDLRHSFLTEVYRQSGDLHAVSELGIHATLEQTKRYAKGAASERATNAIGSVPRFRATTTHGRQSNSLQKTPVRTGTRKAGKAKNRRQKPANSREKMG